MHGVETHKEFLPPNWIFCMKGLSVRWFLYTKDSQWCVVLKFFVRQSKHKATFCNDAFHIWHCFDSFSTSLHCAIYWTWELHFVTLIHVSISLQCAVFLHLVVIFLLLWFVFPIHYNLPFLALECYILVTLIHASNSLHFAIYWTWVLHSCYFDSCFQFTAFFHFLDLGVTFWLL